MFLHTQAETLGISLENFYEGAFEELEEKFIQAPAVEAAYECEEDDPVQFQNYLRKKSGGR